MRGSLACTPLPVCVVPTLVIGRLLHIPVFVMPLRMGTPFPVLGMLSKLHLSLATTDQPEPMRLAVSMLLAEPA